MVFPLPNGKKLGSQMRLIPSEGRINAVSLQLQKRRDGLLWFVFRFTKEGGKAVKKEMFWDEKEGRLWRAPELVLGLQPDELSFYDFPGHADLAALKADYRSALDKAGTLAANPQAIIEEGSTSFSLNIELSWAVQNALLPAPAAAE